MRKREAKYKQEAEQLNWYKSLINEEWYEGNQDWSRAILNWDKTTDEM